MAERKELSRATASTLPAAVDESAEPMCCECGEQPVSSQYSDGRCEECCEREWDRYLEAYEKQVA